MATAEKKFIVQVGSNQSSISSIEVPSEFLDKDGLLRLDKWAKADMPVMPRTTNKPVKAGSTNA
ncbi:hypothetical protein C8N40_111104 [Pontibacter mucosus]|uniref:Uncharacterized protein n=1 Tax=Pontibacter mucosus TaxID=1649266 RepID=A0A2T5YD42_9BACT|nr:hypothetical protein [Pontibacter mucosus]PTX14439.1 hypothetical protein C8N40_111104 [Pontibacter mucosus]